MRNYVIRHGRRIEVDTDLGVTPTKTRNKDFAMVTRAQFERLIAARHAATVKVFLHLQFLVFRSYTKSVRLPNAALAKSKIGRNGKREALAELEELGLIRVTRYQYRAPEIRILVLPGGDK